MEYNCAMYISQIRQMTIRALNQILKKHNITLFNAEQSKILEFLWKKIILLKRIFQNIQDLL